MFLCILLICAVTSSFAQASKSAATPAASPAAAAATPSPATPPSNGEEIIPFLNQTIVWYRELAVQQQLATEPSDVLFFNDNRQIADQIVRQAFDFARARAQALSVPGTAEVTARSSVPSQYQRLADATARVEQQVKNTQVEVDSFRAQLGSANGAKRRTLEAQLSETQSELDLFEARRDVLRTMLQFATGASGAAGGNLTSQVEELARTMPSAAAQTQQNATDNNTTPKPNSVANVNLAARERRQEPTGMIALIGDILDTRRKLNALDNNLNLTDELSNALKELRTPIVAQVRELSKRGDELAAQPDATDPAVLAQQRKDLSALTLQYKQLSATMLPLSKANILLDVYKRTTGNWRTAVDSQYRTQVKGLVLRLAGLGVILGVVLGVFELWRRAIYRYVHEARRRYQFLLLRRIVLWIVIAIVVALAFASEIGAVTTFAGLLTAGIAVALQNVILSVAGYFFLVGKYGVRLGDRVQVANVTGDVVDIGLVRLHLMEVTGGPSPRPTGRVVVFSNAVVFQANAGLFKQIPGTNFLWHEISLTLGPETDYRAAEKRLLEAVNQVYEKYRDRMEQQRKGMERALNTASLREFRPESHLHLTPTGLEVVIRYPVEITTAGEIDDQVTRALLETIEREPRLRLIGSTIKAEEQPA